DLPIPYYGQPRGGSLTRRSRHGGTWNRCRARAPGQAAAAGIADHRRTPRPVRAGGKGLPHAAGGQDRARDRTQGARRMAAPALGGAGTVGAVPARRRLRDRLPALAPPPRCSDRNGGGSERAPARLSLRAGGAVPRRGGRRGLRLSLAPRPGTSAGGLVIAGDSAGGGLTVTTLVALRDAGVPLPPGRVFPSPGGGLTRRRGH